MGGEKGRKGAGIRSPLVSAKRAIMTDSEKGKKPKQSEGEGGGGITSEAKGRKHKLDWCKEEYKLKSKMRGDKEEIQRREGELEYVMDDPSLCTCQAERSMS